MLAMRRERQRQKESERRGRGRERGEYDLITKGVNAISWHKRNTEKQTMDGLGKYSNRKSTKHLIVLTNGYTQTRICP